MARRLSSFSDIVDRFDEREAGSFQRAEALITECLNSIQAAPDSLNDHLPAFSAAIAEWSSVAAPRQFILARRQVNDPRSEQLLGKIRGVCLRLHNDLGDGKTALALTKAALPAFERSPGHLELVKADVETLEERAVTQDALKEIQPLIDFVTDLKSSHSELCASLRRGNFRQDGNGVAAKLFHLFRASAIDLVGTPTSGAPFRVVLSLAIDLHNNSQASEEALILVRALQAFGDVPKDDQLIETLRANGLIAHRTILQKNLTRTTQSSRHRQSARLAQELADTATDEDEQAGWSKLRLEFDRRARVKTWKYAVNAIWMGGLLLFAVIGEISRTSPPSSNPQSHQRAPTIQDYSEAIRLNPANPVAYYNRAFAYANMGQYDGAIQDYDEAIRLNPNVAAAYHGRAIAYAYKEQYNRAIEDYDQTLRLDPNNATALHNRGLAYSNLNQYDQAIQDYDKALSLNPQNASTLNSRGFAYARKGDFDKAIADYNESIRINPQNTFAFNNRGFAFLRTSNFDRAIQDYDRVVQLDTGNFATFFGRGTAYANKGQFDRAIQDYDRAISTDRSQSIVFTARGSALVRIGQYDRAIQDYTQAVQITPQNASPFAGRSLAYLARGDLQQALKDCQEAIRLAPTRRDLIENRGLVYLRLKRVELALADFEAALESNPRLSSSLFARGIIRLRRGDARGNADVSAAQAIQPDVANDLGRYGVHW